MSEPIQERLAEAVARLEQTQRAVAAAERRLQSSSVTVRSRDRSVEVTVNSQGHLSDVRFLDGKYRTMGASQLAAAVVEAARQGQAEMARTVLHTFQPLSETVGGRPHIEGSGVDWGDIFGPLLETVRQGAAGRGGASDRLRDAITEDDEESSDAPRPEDRKKEQR
ncbi:YbaB/EbfC family nucleoid-associated protein [Streptomyces sp. NBC_00654]|uniref:YbaB/EbfC family nucleoid-associated protein n=1 Tax=Streptomyces sp. NBC_00654 TaxID=2975799 RepID=UPI002255CA88|nr:YbaB/EbfC family nucleoid-associated protein [Streptomyces sp. NBC_00654]MCX4966941.1 YbaB/EbfC family nucleoid-associated protein [Streptomyces sp. NBC_00654]